MPTIAEQLTQLESDRQDLVSNLQTKGITGLTGDETFTELVPEVLNIQTGGGSFPITFYNPAITRVRQFARGSAQGGVVNTIYTIGTPKPIPVKKAYILKFDGTLEELTINNNYTGYLYYDTNDIQTEFSYTNVDGQNYISISKFMSAYSYFGYDVNKTGVYVFELDEQKCEFLNNGTYIGIDIGSNITSTTVARYYVNTTDVSISPTTFSGCWSGGYISSQSSINKYFLIPNFINW